MNALDLFNRSCLFFSAPQVCVLDEVQMMADPGRGWGWTRAFLGVPAATLHVCGAQEALPLIQSLAEQCGDELQVNACAEFKPHQETTPEGNIIIMSFGISRWNRSIHASMENAL